MADSRSFNQQGEWGSMSGEKSGSAEWEKVYEALKYAEGSEENTLHKFIQT